jgi:hypothetical protein
MVQDHYIVNVIHLFKLIELQLMGLQILMKILSMNLTQPLNYKICVPRVINSLRVGH